MLHNLALIQGQHPDFQIIPVLKGNAYGHGIVEVAKILSRSDCHFIAVDGYFEAARIRDFATQRILVMGYINPKNAHLLDTKGCSFVVQDVAGLHAFGSLGKPVRIHMELNTGMNRMGLQPGELKSYLKVLKKYPKLELEGVMTHLADADNAKDETFNKKQSTLFDEQVSKIIADGFSPKLMHIAQTAGSVKVKSQYANAIRLGIGLYGLNPLSENDPHFVILKELRPVLELKSKIIKVQTLKAGDKVSYGGTFTAPGSMSIGVLPLGYYEGIPRELSNKGYVTSNGKELPILGRVCMNHTIIDLKDSDLRVNDELTIISSTPDQPNSVSRLQTDYDLFGYTLLTALSSAIRREIV